MKYMGSKARIAKYILPIILKDRKPNQWYIEPFVGGGNMIDKVVGLRQGYDIDKDVIQALNDIRLNCDKLPKNNKEFTENDYEYMRTDNKQPFYGYVAYALSYGGKKWGGWRRDKKGERDYVEEAYKNALRQQKLLPSILLTCSYDEIQLEPKSIIYCDPPYKSTTNYANNFDHEKFWQWCRDCSNEGHQVFISEYDAPCDFECIWQMEICSSLTENTGSKKGIEKLFIYKGDKNYES